MSINSLKMSKRDRNMSEVWQTVCVCVWGGEQNFNISACVVLVYEFNKMGLT